MNRPHILMFGATGQVATEMVAQSEAAGFSLTALGRDQADLTDPGAIRSAIEAAPDATVAVVNAAAYTAVDAAEDDAATAEAVNAVAPGVMAAACARAGYGFVHISTDYVFDGSSDHDYAESDPVAPLGVYGRSKREGEVAVLQALPDAVILRTAWVFSAHGKNFLKTMLRLAESRNELGIVDDQRGGPTPASGIADAVLRVIQAGQGNSGWTGGVFHYCGAPAVSWRQFAEAIFASGAKYGQNVPKVNAITTADYPTPAARPANSVLDCARIKGIYDIDQPDWRRAVDADVAALVAQN
ncbi:dTDP-4-dehydrorhamnose reductase [Maricaulis sp.]|uniref:dTDP-4-dehydrorhamnose reductase n=1 Tax=Maricaulis sp. TaxID=1486257 RepID=UPI00261AEF90|nr:dTDP-4-dehydrorhamnose reductase [Maricaulis sp.]